MLKDKYGVKISMLSEVQPSKKIQYKYNEDEIIADFARYIDQTYGEHYKTEDQDIECFDAWVALGNSFTSFRDTAMKYLWRAGKKGNKEAEKKDLMKTLHYTLMCLHVNHYKEGK